MTTSELGAALVEFLQGAAVIDREHLTRGESMAMLYGEAITKEKAAELLSCSRRTITQYVEDGKILTCCEGKKIDVRSVADFIERKPAYNRRNKKKEDWMV